MHQDILRFRSLALLLDINLSRVILPFTLPAFHIDSINSLCTYGPTPRLPKKREGRIMSWELVGGRGRQKDKYIIDSQIERGTTVTCNRRTTSTSLTTTSNHKSNENESLHKITQKQNQYICNQQQQHLQTTKEAKGQQCGDKRQ